MKRILIKYRKENMVGDLFFMPFFLLFFIFSILPVFMSIGMSFTNNDMLNKNSYIAFENYKQLFVFDKIFYLSVKNTLIFAVITGPIGFFLSFFAAWTINKLKFRNLFSLAFYAPSIASGIAMSVVWLWIFSPDRYGLVNNLLITIGLIDDPILWNQSGSTVLPIVILIQVWMSMGTGFLVFIAGLQNVSRELREAAKIDGIKGDIQELYHIILPSMKPQLLFGSIMSITGSFAVFDIVVGFAGMPSPNYSAHTIVAHMYDYAFIQYNIGYASSIAVVLFIITFSLGQFFMKILSSEGE